MWIRLERGIDGMVGRMLSWLAHPPVRQLASASELEESPLEEVTPHEVHAHLDAFVEAGEGDDPVLGSAGVQAVSALPAVSASEGATSEGSTVEVPVHVDLFVEGPEAVPEEESEDVTLEDKAWAAIEAAARGITPAELLRQTGAQAGDLQPLLQGWVTSGEIVLEQAGMTRRYRKVEP